MISPTLACPLIWFTVTWSSLYALVWRCVAGLPHWIFPSDLSIFPAAAPFQPPPFSPGRSFDACVPPNYFLVHSFFVLTDRNLCANYFCASLTLPIKCCFSALTARALCVNSFIASFFVISNVTSDLTPLPLNHKSNPTPIHIPNS